MIARDIFISHSSADVEVARQLRQALEAGGYSCWLAPDDVVGTQTWTEQILEAIGSCRAAIVLISAQANRSTHVSREVNLALGRGRPVLPVRIEDVAPEGSLEYLLSLVQRVDAFPPPMSNYGPLVLRRLEALLSTAATPSQPGTEPAAEPAAVEDGASDVAPGEALAEAPADVKAIGAKRGRPRKPGGGRHAAGIGPGSDVGGFVIEDILGEGGMARVFRARQAEPNRAVALKVIRPDKARSAAYREHFLTEKATLASLEHPSIVPIYAAGDDDGVLYIAMRLIDGVDLSTRIASQGRLGIRETVEVLRPVADAIDYAHEMGIVHRDLKPANIILDRRGRPYLTDFGIGQQATTGAAEIGGIVMGTAEYMAPELATGDGSAGGPPSDIYALGCIAFACLTGAPPFVRPSSDAVIAAHASDPVPSIRALRQELPKAVDQLVQKALARDPAARFPTANEFVSGLETVAQAASAGSTQPVVLPEMRTAEARVRRWLGANVPLAVIGSSLAAIGLVVAIALATGGNGGPTAPPSAAASRVATPGASPVGGDVQPPVGGRLEVRPRNGTGTVTTERLVTVAVTNPPTDASAVARYLAANSPVRPPVADALPYVSSFPWELGQANGLAGERSVYVWFADANGNWQASPVTASITFDNPPVVRSGLFYNRTGPQWCESLSQTVSVVLVGDIATDPDGNETLEVTHLWTGGAEFPGTTDLSGAITPDGRGVEIPVKLPDDDYVVVEDWFRVEDEHGITAEGSFNLELGNCAATAP